MRAGRLRTPAQLISNSGKTLVGNLFIGITEPDAHINFGDGLLSNERAVIRARWQKGDVVQAGTWLKTTTGRLFLVVGFSQPKTRQDLVLGAREAVGYRTEIIIGTDAEGEDITASGLVVMMNYLEKPDSGNAFMPVEVRQRAQFANAEHRPKAGERFSYGAENFEISELDAPNSNEFVTTCWVRQLTEND